MQQLVVSQKANQTPDSNCTVCPAGEAASRLCDCQLAFTVWPAAEPQVRRQPSISHGGAPSISHSHSAAAAEEQQYPPLISYQLNITNCKLRWQQVVPAQVQQSALQKQLSMGEPTH